MHRSRVISSCIRHCESIYACLCYFLTRCFTIYVHFLERVGSHCIRPLHHIWIFAIILYIISIIIEGHNTKQDVLWLVVTGLIALVVAFSLWLMVNSQSHYKVLYQEQGGEVEALNVPRPLSEEKKDKK